MLSKYGDDGWEIASTTENNRIDDFYADGSTKKYIITSTSTLKRKITITKRTEDNKSNNSTNGHSENNFSEGDYIDENDEYINNQ